VRHQGAGRDGLSWYFANYNRNKRSITLNLRSDEGRAILTRLIARSDVLLDNYRPGVLDAMGFTAARLAELNPRLVRGSITGFGSSGPYRDRPSFDFIAQAMSGFMSVNGAADQPPMRSGPPVSDLIAGLYAALGVVAGLLRERQSGQGGAASVSLIGGLISFLSFMATDYLATGRLPRRTGNDHPIGSPYGLFRTADGEIAIAPAGEAMYQRLLLAVDAEELRQRPEFATNALRAENRAAINAEIEARTMRETSEHWIRVLNAAGVPCSRVMHLGEVFADPQVVDQQAVVTVRHPGRGDVSMLGSAMHLDGAPLPVRLPAPELGAHTEEVLVELGLASDEIDQLRGRGVL
jgi:crotonobetainyl-CoA:carnitine CoA-transferase CaiB-like acyl-CoA transferase